MCKGGATAVAAAGGAEGARFADPEHWIEIKGECYDISNFRKVHPGGHVISYFAKQDATDAFFNFHAPALLDKYAHLRRPRHPSAPKPSAATDPATVALLAEYREWNAELRRRGLFDAQPVFFFAQMALALALFFGAFPMYFLGWHWTSALVAGVAQVQFGWLMHDLGHRSVTTTIRGDSRLNRIVMQFFQGGNAGWWTSKHNRHHLLPNVLDHDPDIHTDPVFVWSKKMKGGFWNSLQAFYFPILGPPVGVMFMNVLVLRYALRHREWLSFAWICVFTGLWCYFLSPVHFFVMRVVQGLWFQWVVAVNHFSEHVLDKNEAQGQDWVRLVSATTANVSGGWFLNWFTGHLNYQIEHHLFPRMPRCNYPKVAPEARAFFLKHGVKYRSYTPWEATVRLFKTLHRQECLD